MAVEKEPAKALLPYLQRADELQKHEPLVAYYCRLYAMERGLKIPNSERTKTTNALLVSLMNQLEKDRKSLVLGPDDHFHVEGFALNVFVKADKQDRAGRADLNTAKTFYAASIFFEILYQFGELQPDLEQKQKYAVWKAADIRKALTEGRKPLPGPPGRENDSFVLPSASTTEYGAEVDRSGTAVGPDFTSTHPARSNVPDHDQPPEPYPQDNFHHSNISPEPSDIPQSSSFQTSPESQYPSDNPAHQTYYSQQYQPPPPPHLPQLYSSPPHDPPSYAYPNFQSYPSFSESSSLPSAPTHYPSYHQGSDASHASSSPSNATAYHSASPYISGDRNGNVPEAPLPTSSRKYEYDSSYQPPPEKIAEAHKAARFAVGALAFDDVSVAVDHLKKSLELLTNPSA